MRSRASLLCVTIALAFNAPGWAQVVPAGRAIAAESAVVTPGPEYTAAGVYRLLFGEHYRTLWTTPIKVPVLSLREYAGGLRPVKHGGGMQTNSLHMVGADGREYVFRSVDKDPARSLPPDLRETYAKQIVRDLISAGHPGGAAVVARLLDSVELLHTSPKLMVMPDDPLLGEFRKDFAGMLGWIEIRPTQESEDRPGFEDASSVKSSEKLLERLATHPDEQVDARAYLEARLFDIFIGDWDRHAEQWLWARFGSQASDRWQPIPRDRDWALVRLDGAVWTLVRFVYPYPQFVSFERAAPDITWLTWTGRLLDRRFLSALSRPAWDSVTTTLQHSLSDKVIDDATRQLPPEFYRQNGAELAETLRWRRDHLDEFARRFYRLLSGEVEVHARDVGGVIEVDRIDDRFTDVTVRTLTKSGIPRSRPMFRRRFDGEETREIRIYLHAGDQALVVRGATRGATLVRVIGGGGTNTYFDSTSGASGMRRLLVYDTARGSRLETTSDAAAAVVDRRAYEPPRSARWYDPPRDWGSRWRPWPWIGYTPDIGLFVGGGPLLEQYGFRADPYRYRMTLRVGYATGAGRWRAEYDADVRRPNSRMYATLFARASGLDVVHYYGAGNETAAPAPAAFYRVDQQQYAFDPTLNLSLAPSVTVGLGPTLRDAVTSRESNRLVAYAHPYGSDTYSQIGARLRVIVDTRDDPANARRGVLLSARAAGYPSLWTVSRPYGELRSQAATYLGAGGYFQPTVALRVGGDKIWGPHPFFDAAFVGGESTVRGWAEHRFSGDASIYGNAELRLFLTKFFFLLPADLGVFGLTDAGRVFVPGEQSSAMHYGSGGGLWIAPLGRRNTLSIAYARSRESSGIYLRTGFLY